MDVKFLLMFLLWLSSRQKTDFPKTTSKSFTKENSMKKIISQFFAIMLLFSSIGLPSFILAESPKKPFQKMMDKNEKCYLIPGSLLMDEKRLYVHFDDMLYPINNVSVDEQGVYILANDLVDSGIIARCPDGHPNPPWCLVCQICGKNLYQK
jgi:hypothetical protein